DRTGRADSQVAVAASRLAARSGSAGNEWRRARAPLQAARRQPDPRDPPDRPDSSQTPTTYRKVRLSQRASGSRQAQDVGASSIAIVVLARDAADWRATGRAAVRRAAAAC